MKFLRSHWFPLILGLIAFTVIAKDSFFAAYTATITKQNDSYDPFTNQWQAPSTSALNGEEAKLVLYGKELIANTSLYFGPKGKIARTSNGMNCQNCHLDAGTKNYSNSFSAVASTYPKYRDRSGKMETIEFRINECMERSLNGKELDPDSREMKAMVAYLQWLGKDVPKDVKPEGAGTEDLPFLAGPADPLKGQVVFLTKCQACHGAYGQGLMNSDSTLYIYPPLWGPNSYNVSAGMYRLSKFAAFVKNSMPYGASYAAPKLSNEEAWNVAAFVNSQPRPEKFFNYDWPDISKKPVDHPFPPFADPFSERQHKYGPFQEIKEYKSDRVSRH